MSSVLILVIAGVVLVGAYFLYGGYLERVWGIDEKKKTPAFELRDGVDYEPARKSVIFGHQFASIAGAGPINGPIIAAMFGWVPVLLWILIGGIFIGAVQDFGSMYASVRNKGKTIGYIIEQYIGKVGKVLFLVFVWLFCILVIAAFADVVAATFNGFNSETLLGITEVITANLSGFPDSVSLNAANASTASTSVLFIFAALLFSFILTKTNPSALLTALYAVVLLVGCIVLGLYYPFYMSKDTWSYVVFAYVFAASVMPVWMLLQPRDYLNAYLLLAMILAAAVGVFFAQPTMNLPAFVGFEVGGFSLFPMLFVTVACGAVSGFHSLVSSGTASKQIQNERDMRFISYGAMLFECFLAVIALVAVGALYTDAMPQGSPPVIFANALAGFLAEVGLPTQFSFTLLTLAISAFALTSLDSVARIGRMAFQEMFTGDSGARSALTRFLSDKYVATLFTLVFGYLLSIKGYMNIWPLFGSANQLLAALAFIALAVYLKSTGKKGSMLYVPMVFMLVVTLSALAITIARLVSKLGPDVAFDVLSDGLQLSFAILLTGLALVVAWQGLARLKAPSVDRTDDPESGEQVAVES